MSVYADNTKKANSRWRVSNERLEEKSNASVATRQSII